MIKARSITYSLLLNVNSLGLNKTRKAKGLLEYTKVKL